MFYICKKINKKMTKEDYLEKLGKDDCLVIIKYGLRNLNVPNDVNVEDIYEVIGCLYISGAV